MRTRPGREKEYGMGNSKLVLKIEGMRCGHCLASVEKVLRGLPGVVSLRVGMGKVQVTCDENPLNINALSTAIEKAGFRLLPLKQKTSP